MSGTGGQPKLSRDEYLELATLLKQIDGSIFDVNGIDVKKEDNPVLFMQEWVVAVNQDDALRSRIVSLKQDVLSGGDKENHHVKPDPVIPDAKRESIRHMDSWWSGAKDNDELLNDDITNYLTMNRITSSGVASPVPDSILEEESPAPDSTAIQIDEKYLTRCSPHCYNGGPEVLSKTLDDECARIEKMIRANLSSYFEGKYPVVPVGQVNQSECLIIGRILGEDIHQPITIHTLLLEGSNEFSSHGLVSLRLDKMNPKSAYYLYPGKIVVCYGICEASTNKNDIPNFYVYDMISCLQPLVDKFSPISLPLKPGVTTDITVLGGPFSPSNANAMDLRRLRMACDRIRRIQPSCAVLVGPFITEKTFGKNFGAFPIYARGIDGVVTYDQIYRRMISAIIEGLCEQGIQTIVIPHNDDILNWKPLPQSFKDANWSQELTHSNLHFGQNPLSLNVNGLSVSIIGADIVKDLQPQRFKGRAITNSKKKAVQMHREFIEQGNLMCGTGLSSVGLAVGKHTLEACRLTPHENNDKENNTQLILHSAYQKLFKVFRSAGDRAVGNIKECLVHIRVLPESPERSVMFDEINGRVQISVHACDDIKKTPATGVPQTSET